ncbi:MAG: phage tail assembly chaperone [Paracoccaceae bacterium]
MTPRGLDWPGMMRAGLHGLGLRPAEFWALTPAELMIMLGRDNMRPGFSRATLDQLQRRFPDQPKPSTKGKDDDDDHRSGC